MESLLRAEPGIADPASGEKLRLIEVLDIRLVEIRDLCVRQNASSSTSSSSGNDRSVFCIVKLDKEEIFRSSAVAKTQNPHFGDDFHFEVPKHFTCLSFYVYDQIPNRVARPIGRVTFRKQDLARYSGLDRWWHLKPVSRHSDVTGKIWLDISRYPHESSTKGSSSGTQYTGDARVFVADQSFSIRVLDYCDMNQNRSNDMYAIVSLHYPDGSQAETIKLRMRRRPPQSSSDGCSAALRSQDVAVFTLKEPWTNNCPSECATPVLRVSVWHDILGSFSSYFHGEARVPIDESLYSHMVSGQQSFNAWFSLTPRSNTTSVINFGNGDAGNNKITKSIMNLNSGTVHFCEKENNSLGSLRLKITYSVDHILPAYCYTDLWERLLDALSVKPFKCSIIGLLSALPRSDLERIARPLVKIFLHSEHQLRPLIRVLCAEEIAPCQDVNTLFRSSSLASKCIYELMKLVGQQYLISTLKPVVEKVFSERYSCEIDPDRLDASASIKENRAHLMHYTEMALSRIFDSCYRCPSLLKDVFRILRETTERYHPNNSAVQWLVLGSFLIMRFFAAALLNPKLFWLRRDNADAKVQRTLALMSKIIQRLCNYVVVGHTLTEKETFLTPVFEYFADDTHARGLIKFFERISCAGGENSITGESITVLKEGILRERIPKRKKGNVSFLFNYSLPFSPCLNFRNAIQRSTSKCRICYLTETEFYWQKEKGQSLLGRMALADITIVQSAKELFNNPLVLEIRSDRSIVYLEASNEVELGEWIAALQRACRRQALAQQQLTENAAKFYEINVEQQLETVHMIFLENFEVLQEWKGGLIDGSSSSTSCEGHLGNVDAQGRETFSKSLSDVLDCVVALEQKHVDHIKNFEQMQYGSKEMPIGDDNYLLLGSRMRDYAAICAFSDSGAETYSPPTLDPGNSLVNDSGSSDSPATVAVLHEGHLMDE